MAAANEWACWQPAPTIGHGACTGDDSPFATIDAPLAKLIESPLAPIGGPLEMKPTPSNQPVGVAYANNIQLPGVGS